jgi:hypothetical protein
MKTSLASMIALATLGVSASAQTLANYQAMVSSQNPSNYFKLDGSLESAVNPSVVLESFAGGYAADVFRIASNCWFFVDQNTAFLRYTSGPLINGGGVSNTTSTAKGSISFLFRALSGPNIGGQRTLYDATTVNVGTTNHNAFTLFFENETSTENPNSLKLRFGDSTTTIMLSNNVIYGSWYYFALTYDEARVPNKAIWYLAPVGGAFSTGMTTNSAESVAGDGTGLLIGQRANLSGAYRSPGSGRVDEFAIWARELSFLEISNQFATLPQPAPPGASYQQVIAAQIPKYHFKLDNSLIESVSNILALSTNGDGGAFTSDALGNANSAYSFSATNDALYVTNDLVNGGGPTQNSSQSGLGTISFQFRMLNGDTNTGQRFIFSAPGAEVNTTDDNQLALFIEGPNSTNYPNSLKLRVGNQTSGSSSSDTNNIVPIAYATNLVPNAWYYFAMTYDESRNSSEVLYYFGQAGGSLRAGLLNPANASVIGDNGPLVIGNMIYGGVIQDNAFRNPGQGAIDEFAIWHEELSAAEIQAQFAAMSPVVLPQLNIALSGGNVLLSWPASTPASFALETTNALDSTTISAASWPSAGIPTVVGSSYFVTNAVSSGNRFYRLHKP